MTRVTLVCLALLMGCSSIPPGGDPSNDPAILAMAKSTQDAHGRLAIAPLSSISLAEHERAKGWNLDEVAGFTSTELQGDVALAARASGRWGHVRDAETGSLADSWASADQYLASVEISELRSSFDGHNALWIPNVVNFIMNVFPAWWVATEEYSLSLQLGLKLRSVASGGILATRSVPLRVEGTFDEFDRGLQLLGPIWPRFDAETWHTIVSKLLPAMRRQVAVTAAQTLDAMVRDAPEALWQRDRQTLALVLGTSRYQRSNAFPPAPQFSRDAARVADRLVANGICRAEQVRVLSDAQVTRDQVLRAVREHLGRSRPADTVVVYVAGYGSRDRAGDAALVLHDAGDRPDAGWLLLSDLAKLLGGLDGKALLVVDAAFAGEGRSVQHDAPAPRYPVAAFADAGVSALLACESTQTALTPAHLDGGLLTYHMLRHLDNAEGTLTLAELHVLLASDVMADAELLGHRQTPVQLGPSGTSLTRRVTE